MKTKERREEISFLFFCAKIQKYPFFIIIEGEKELKAPVFCPKMP